MILSVGVPPGNKLARVTWLVVWGLMLLLGGVVAARLLAHDGLWCFAVANLFSPYVYLPAWPIALVAGLAKRWRLLMLAGILVGFHAHWTLVPLLPKHPPAGAGPSIRVVTANLLTDNDSPSLLADELESLSADVYFLQELSQRWDEELERRGFWRRLPFNRRAVGETPFGCAIASKVPIRDFQPFSLAALPAMRGWLSVGGREIEIMSVHLVAPRGAEEAHDHALGADQLVQRLRRQKGHPFVFAGDLNATADSRLASQLDELADDGWELAGRGLGVTWPNGTLPLPPIRIDHVYVSRELTVARIWTGVGRGSDHRPVIAEIAFRRP